MDIYIVNRIDEPINGSVTVPGSKSVTNRALLMAALSNGTTVLNGVLFSDDSEHFLECLKELGFKVDIDKVTKTVAVTGNGGIIPAKSGKIYVGSAGTAARFLTAMTALSDGEYYIDASEQMKARPMKPLFDALTELGAEFEYQENAGFLPVKVKGRKKINGQLSNTVHLDISKSTQFLSALLMTGSMLEEGLDIKITSEKTDGSYIRITTAMMKDFGVNAIYDGHDYKVLPHQKYNSGKYDIEPDISAACYFWAIAAVTGGSITVNGVKKDMMQGDIRFLEALEKMGCEVVQNDIGITVKGSKELQAVDVDMNNFSDQTMTLAAIAPYASGTTYIRNVGHIRLQESDRVNAIITNLTAMGIACEAVGDDIIIKEGQPHSALIKTFDDHRMAMAFAVTGLKADGIEIENPQCCRKTFAEYFQVFDKLCYMK